MNKIKTRRAESAARCYSELIVADVFYQKAAIYGRSLRTLFPPKEGEDAIAALDELVGVCKRNFDEYARNARQVLSLRSTR